MKLTVHIAQEPDIGGMGIYILGENDDGARFIAEQTELAFTTFEDGAYLKPTFIFSRRIGEEFLSGLASALVKAGYRPEELKAGQAEVEALRYHLEDMRSLVFKPLVVKK